MNEAETRAEYIDQKLRESGWGVTDGTKVHREFPITLGRIEVGGTRAKPQKADYVLVYKSVKLAVIEAKHIGAYATEGVAQAKEYAKKLSLDVTYATNGKEIYEIGMKSGKEGYVAKFPTPEELWRKVYAVQNEWREKFLAVPFEDVSGTKPPRYYQEIAVANTLEAMAGGRQRILLTLATGTGKTFIAAQIAWKLFQTRWNLKRDGSRRPRILFLADRNNLATQAQRDFSFFPDDAIVHITPDNIRRRGSVPTNGSIFFAIFQTFMSGPNNTPYYGDYPADFFDFIIIDECHRGGANDEGNWRGILEYFSPAVQLGLTATPKRIDNADTYKYFGEPVYVYSLKEGVNDGFLTPFKVKRIQTTLDQYVYTSDDTVVEGEVEEGKVYEEADFNKIIEIKAREEKRVKVVLEEINQEEKTIVFCATQIHALAVRDLINQYKKSTNPDYCVRVTANDGALGDTYLKQFQDNEKTIPTILTTSQKLSTGVDARNIRNIVLLRPVNSMIEFKQIIGRGTRLFDGKEYFTIFDFVDAYKHFADPAWDGEPIDETTDKPKKPKRDGPSGEGPMGGDPPPEPPKAKLKIRLRDGKEREIQHMIQTMFLSADGTHISSEEFLRKLFGDLPQFFKDEGELRKIWSNPKTRQVFLEKIAELGYDKERLEALQKLVNAEQSDLFDALAYVSFALKPITRTERVQKAESVILKGLDDKQKDFLKFVLAKYEERGVEELAERSLPELLKLKYRNAIADAERELGGVEEIRFNFFNFQKDLYRD